MYCPVCRVGTEVKRIMFTTKNIQVDCKECGQTQYYAKVKESDKPANELE